MYPKKPAQIQQSCCGASVGHPPRNSGVAGLAAGFRLGLVSSGSIVIFVRKVEHKGPRAKLPPERV